MTKTKRRARVCATAALMLLAAGWVDATPAAVRAGKTKRIAPAQAAPKAKGRPVARRMKPSTKARPATRAAAPQAGMSSQRPRHAVMDLAMRAFRCGEQRGELHRPLLTIIDYSLPSSQRRLWVIDTRTKRVLFHELVAHGRNSGDDLAVAFSNAPGSHRSSLGLFRTAETYRGRHGHSLRLIGLEPGINDRAEDRAIVMHGASYVSAAFAARHGRLGRSLGCPALGHPSSRRVIERIKDGSAVFAYYPDRRWLEHSRFLHCDARVATR